MIFKSLRIGGDQFVQDTGNDIYLEMLIWSKHIRQFAVQRMTGFIGTYQTADTNPWDFTVFAFHDTFYMVAVFQGMTTDGAA